MSNSSEVTSSSVPSGFKVCTKCLTLKSLSEFYIKKSGRGKGRPESHCISCIHIRNNEYRDKNKDKINENLRIKRAQNIDEVRQRAREYYAVNSQRYSIRNKKYRDKNKEKALLRSKIYRDAHKEEKRLAGIEWRAKNKEIIRLKKQKDYENNKEKIKTRSKNRYYAKREEITKKNVIYMNKKRKADPTLRLSNAISKRIHTALKKNKGGKSWKKYVDYSLEELKQHLESQFTEGMTWDNYGKGSWVIDHIRPLCSYSYNSFEDEDFKLAWALSNLRPLWEVDNLKKISEDKKLSIRKRLNN